MTDILLNVFLCIVSIGEVWLCYQFVYSFYLNKTYRSKLEIAIMWMNIFSLGILLTINRTHVFFSYLMLWFCIVATTIFMWLIAKRDLLWILGMNALFYGLQAWLDLFFSFICLGYLKERFEGIVYMQSTPFASTIIFIISRLAIASFIYLIYQKRTMTEIMEYKYIFTTVGIILCILLRRYQKALIEMSFGEQEMQAANGAISLLIALGIILVIGTFVVKYKMLKKEKAFLTLKDELMEEKYQALTQSQQILHDMKNHLIVIRDYKRNNELDKLDQYLDEISSEYIIPVNRSWTGNSVLDLLLNQKWEKAKSEEINMEIETGILHWIPLSDSEIISLYGNLIDNALEACADIKDEEKYIRIKTEKKREMLFIRIVNTFSQAPVIRNGRFITRKQDKGIHGYGIERVKSIVNKYEGLFLYHIEGNTFEVSITFFDSKTDHK